MEETKVFQWTLHKELWHWLAENPEQSKDDWPRWRDNGGQMPKDIALLVNIAPCIIVVTAPWYGLEMSVEAMNLSMNNGEIATIHRNVRSSH